MLLQRRHTSLSSGKRARSRWGSLSESTNARAASVICRVDTPVFLIGKSPGAAGPPVVMPLKGSATRDSPVSTYFCSCGGSSAWRARAESGVRCRTLKRGGGLGMAQSGGYGRQHLAGDPSHEAAVGVVRRGGVRDRVQAHVVERGGRRPQHVQQLLHDLGRAAAQAERVGGGVGQE